jgi:hypothetical protein
MRNAIGKAVWVIICCVLVIMPQDHIDWKQILITSGLSIATFIYYAYTGRL